MSGEEELSRGVLQDFRGKKVFGEVLLHLAAMLHEIIEEQVGGTRKERG